MSATLTSRHDAVVLYPSRRHVPEHEDRIHHDIARRIANLLGRPFDGVYDSSRHASGHWYFVPTDTVLTPATREALGIRNELDLFGGYADHPFMPTKAITHGLVGPHAQRPAGWSDAVVEHVRGATLPGRTAFSVGDLRIAAQQLGLGRHALRLKPVKATGGRGQTLLADADALEAELAQLDTESLAQFGIVLELHLQDVTTYSVGQLRLPGLTASYIGTQRLTSDRHGEPVYGGSQLLFARGGYGALDALPLGPARRLAVRHAQRYDRAADACYPGFFASRRNYDIAAGTGPDGETLIGVLEQSWRIGGASRAEIAAAEVFAADPACTRIWAETREIFNDSEPAPPDALLTYAGVDPELGRICKYVMVHAYDHKHAYD